MRILGKASWAVLLAFVLAGAAVWSVEADTLTPTGGTQFTDAQFSGVGINGTQTITQGFNTDVLGCPMMSPQPPCLDSGTVDVLFSGGTADGLIVQGSKFYVDIVGNLSSIFTSYTASGVGVSGTLSSITNIAGQGCHLQIGETPSQIASFTTNPTGSGAVCTNNQLGYFSLTSISPDTFVASNGSIGVTFSLNGSTPTTTTTTPEPSSLLMLFSGLVGLGFMKRKVFQN